MQHTTDHLIIELRTGLWMVKQVDPAMIRGYISQVEAPDGPRFSARLPHLNPTQGPRLGEYWEWDRAVEAVLAEQPRPLVADPFTDLRYSDPVERAERLEKRRSRRRFAGRFS